MKKTYTGALLAATLLFAPPGHAQLRLPGGGLGGLGGLPDLNRPVLRDSPLRQRIDQTLAPADLLGLRQRLTDQLLERHPRELMRGPDGALIVRQQLLALPSSQAARAQLLALPGVTLLEETRLDGLDLGWLLLRADVTLLPRLRELDPPGDYDFQHVYLGSGEVDATARPADSPAQASAPQARVGLIDSGIDMRHPALRGVAVSRHGCAGQPHPTPHGTAVASLLVGRDVAEDFRGALPGATLYAADAYCDAPDGGSVQSIAQALAWLARERVGVINISLVGPPNLLLQRAVAATQARGHLIVAAVGNDGPAAPPLFPAAWPGVIAVTGVDGGRRVLAEAGRGPHVLLAAPGSQMVGAASGGNGYVALRGTSFAAPLVAGLLAARLAQPDEAAARDALAQLRKQAIDLGASGPDEVYGWGLVGEILRTAKSR